MLYPARAESQDSHVRQRGTEYTEWPSSGLEHQREATNGRSPLSLDYAIECEEQNIVKAMPIFIRRQPMSIAEMPDLGCKKQDK